MVMMVEVDPSMVFGVAGWVSGVEKCQVLAPVTRDVNGRRHGETDIPSPISWPGPRGRLLVKLLRMKQASLFHPLRDFRTDQEVLFPEGGPAAMYFEPAKVSLKPVEVPSEDVKTGSLEPPPRRGTVTPTQSTLPSTFNSSPARVR